MNESEQMINNCEECNKVRPSKRNEPLIQTKGDYPFHKPSADICEYDGKNISYLLIIIRDFQCLPSYWEQQMMSSHELKMDGSCHGLKFPS